MTRTEVAVVALIVLVVAWLLMPPPVAPAPDPVVDPYPALMARIADGHVQPLGCAVFLPSVVVTR